MEITKISFVAYITVITKITLVIFITNIIFVMKGWKICQTWTMIIGT